MLSYIFLAIRKHPSSDQAEAENQVFVSQVLDNVVVPCYTTINYST